MGEKGSAENMMDSREKDAAASRLIVTETQTTQISTHGYNPTLLLPYSALHILF